MKLFRRSDLAATGLHLRVLTALVVVPLLLAVIWFGEPWFTMAVAAVAFLGLNEFYKLVSHRWARPFVLMGYLWTALFILNAQFSDTDTMPIVVAGVLVLSLLVFPLRRRWREDLVPWALTLVGAFLLGWALSYLVFLREAESGREWVLLALFTVFAADTSAYFVGKAIGRHKLAPRISPKKTWEGVAGGVAGALLVSALISYFLEIPAGIGHVLGLAGLIAVVSPLGDLSESLLKRWVGVKEAARSLPGHGGVLDRLDSVVFTIVLVYYYVQWITD